MGRVSFMRRWWQPSLMRRVLAALLLAFGLVGVALLGMNYVEFQRSMAEHAGVKQLADALLDTLASTPDERDAVLIVSNNLATLNRMRRQGGQLPGDVKLRLRHADQRLAWQSADLGTDAPEVELDRVSVQAVAGRPHWVIESRQGPWQLLLAEPALEGATLLEFFWGDMAASLLVAFPIVLLPVWLAVWGGLRPLRRLTQHVRARAADDLSPLAVPAEHAELRPLVQAFDGLLARLRQQVQRERAFVQDAAHELRTPMAVVASQAEVLAGADTAEERQQAVAALQAALKRSSHLSEQLLTLASLDAQRPSQPRDLDLAAQTEQLLAQLAPQALAKRQDLSFEAPPQLPARLDPLAWDGVVLNLIANALRYVPEGGRIAVTLSSGSGQACLRVADDGPGIPPAQREQAFDRFWRGATGDSTGTGLGLAIVRRAVHRIGGRVHIEDGLDGQGVAFVVRFGCA